MPTIKKYSLGFWVSKKLILQSFENFYKMVRIILGLGKKNFDNKVMYSGYRNSLWMPILLLLDIRGNTEWRCD